MPEKVYMNYETMRQMVKEFKAAQQTLEETVKAVTKLGSQMESGGLQGQAGDTFRGAINGPLSKALKKLATKMGEEAKDVDAARAKMEEGVATSRTHFTN